MTPIIEIDNPTNLTLDLMQLILHPVIAVIDKMQTFQSGAVDNLDNVNHIT